MSICTECGSENITIHPDDSGICDNCGKAFLSVSKLPTRLTDELIDSIDKKEKQRKTLIEQRPAIPSQSYPSYPISGTPQTPSENTNSPLATIGIGAGMFIAGLITLLVEEIPVVCFGLLVVGPILIAYGIYLAFKK